MKRRFAVPAAIALTAHALLFVGSGKPPAPASVPAPAVIIEKASKTTDEIVEKIELLRDETMAMADPKENAGGGTGEEPPPGVLDLPRINGVGDPLVFTQEVVPIRFGHGTKITNGLSIGTGTGSGLGDAAVSVSSLDNPPRTRFQKEPVYPHTMKTSGTSGTVWVEFVVDETGRVHDARVVKSTHPGFEDATLAAVSMWRFEPGKRKGLPVRFRMSIPVVFNLTD